MTWDTTAALAVIQQCEEFSTQISAAKNNFLSRNNLDDEPFDRVSEMKKQWNQILMQVPVVSMKLGIFADQVSQQFQTLVEARKVLANKIKDFEQSTRSPNFNVVHYDEEQLISEFSIDMNDHSFGSMVQTIHMDQIIDPKEYTNLSLIRRFEMEDQLTTEIFNRIRNTIATHSSDLTIMTDLIKEDIEYLESKDAYFLIDLIQKKEYEKLESKFHHTINLVHKQGVLTRISRDVKAIVRIIMELVHNMKVYEKAGSSYTAPTLESVFSYDSNITY